MPPCQRRHFLFLWFVFWDLLLGSIPPHRMFAQICGKKIKWILQAWSHGPNQYRPQIDTGERKPTWSSCTGGLSDTFSVCWWRCCMLSEGCWALQVFVCIFCGFPSKRRNIWCKERCVNIKRSQVSQATFNVWDVFKCLCCCRRRFSSYTSLPSSTSLLKEIHWLLYGDASDRGGEKCT